MEALLKYQNWYQVMVMLVVVNQTIVCQTMVMLAVVSQAGVRELLLVWKSVHFQLLPTLILFPDDGFLEYPKMFVMCM